MSNSLIRQAIEMAVANVRRDGGPFAALVVKDGAVIATGVDVRSVGATAAQLTSDPPSP